MGLSVGAGVTAKPTVRTRAARTSIFFSIRFLLRELSSIAYESYVTSLCLRGRTLSVSFPIPEQKVRTIAVLPAFWGTIETNPPMPRVKGRGALERTALADLL